MNKLISTLLLCGLVIILFLGVFQDSLSITIVDKGKEVEKIIEGRE